MKIEIPEEIIQKTVKCNKNLRCLSGDDKNLCRVICYIGKDTYFVRCLDDKGCPYLEAHKKTELCNCPVRNEIYNRYKK